MAKLADRATSNQIKRRWLKKFRRRRQNLEELGEVTERSIDKLVFRRISRLNLVRRFLVLWTVTIALLLVAGTVQLRSLSPYYQSLQPVPGGIYSEGLVGSFTNANPLYADGAADESVSRLVFDGLFKYDQSGELAPDLATSWSVDKLGTTYTVNLRHNVHWQDGKLFNSADVVFTYETIQKTEAESPLFSSWQGVGISPEGSYRVVFTLDSPLASFPDSLTTGIIPKHLLGNIPAGQLRSASFNTQPVGTGPFEWRFVSVTGGTDVNRQQQITLAPNANYWAGAPKLNGFDLATYRNDNQLVDAFRSKQVNAIAGLDDLPPQLASDKSLSVYHIPLDAIVMAFFNNSHGVLASQGVRQALASSIDRTQLLNLFNYPPNLVSGPILPSEINYSSATRQIPHSFKNAQNLLASAGWRKASNGYLYKDGKLLQLDLASQNTPSLTAVSQFLQDEWSRLGVKVLVTNSPASDLEASTIPDHNYDILLYGIAVGIDPDVFAYWDSSQISPDSTGHSNLSEYQSTLADQELEAARTRSTMALRVPKYNEFLRTWRADAPALALYQPNYLYISRSPVAGFQRHTMNSAADRFYNVANWEIRQQRQSN